MQKSQDQYICRNMPQICLTSADILPESILDTAEESAFPAAPCHAAAAGLQPTFELHLCALLIGLFI